MGGTAALDGLVFRRAESADAPLLVQLMSERQVLHNTLQLPLPGVEFWRERLERQARDSLQLHVLATDGATNTPSAATIASLLRKRTPTRSPSLKMSGLNPLHSRVIT